MGYFLSWGRVLKVRASDPFPKQNTRIILAAKTHKKLIKTGPFDRGTGTEEFILFALRRAAVPGRSNIQTTQRLQFIGSRLA
jgi:hypothetical protein